MATATGRFIIYSPYLNDELDSKYRASGISALNMFVSIVLIIGMFISGYLTEEFDGRTTMTIAGIFSLLIILPLSLNLYRMKNKLGINVYE
jgi:MFS-type transporter involved in bile tolerance (Atg22 family)